MPDLSDFLPQVGEHRVERLTVHLHLELVFVFECDSTLGRRSCANLIDEPLKILKFVPCALAHNVRDETRPAPNVHVDDGVSVTKHVTPFGESYIENPEMALCRIRPPRTALPVDVFR